MKKNKSVFVFILLGLTSAAVCGFLSFLKPVVTIKKSDYSNHTEQYATTTTYKQFGNSAMGALGFGIIAASCFIVSAVLLKKESA